MENPQLNIFESRANRDEGINRSVMHADAVEENWSARAYNFLLKFLETHRGTFQAEEVRSYAAMVDFPLPPSARSWGAIFVRAKKEGIISSVGIAPVRNVKAHRANASVWIQVKKAS